MISKLTEFFSSSNWIFTACVAYKNQVRTEMEFSYSQTENFEMEKLSNDTGYFKKPVEINRAALNFALNQNSTNHLSLWVSGIAVNSKHFVHYPYYRTIENL